jgi:putative membrane protein
LEACAAIGALGIRGQNIQRCQLNTANLFISPFKEIIMATVALVLIALVALLHVYFMVLEMFYWDKPLGLKAFGNTQQAATATKVLAANQGLYNGFLAAGLVVGLVMGDAGFAFKLFFLICVLIAGLYGGATASKKILYVQALPAALALGALWLSK